jgi:hypothetical protein
VYYCNLFLLYVAIMTDIYIHTNTFKTIEMRSVIKRLLDEMTRGLSPKKKCTQIVMKRRNFTLRTV